MKSDELIEVVTEELDRIGVKPAFRSVRKIPAAVEVEVMVDGERHSVKLRSGIPQWEVDLRLGDLRAWLARHDKNQVDLEEWLSAEKTNR